jgi:hypothetical protein
VSYDSTIRKQYCVLSNTPASYCCLDLFLISEAEYCVLWQYSKQLTIFIFKTYFKSVKLSTVSYHSTVLCPMAVPEATVLCPITVLYCVLWQYLKPLYCVLWQYLKPLYCVLRQYLKPTVLCPMAVPEANCTVSYGSTCDSKLTVLFLWQYR